MTTLLLTALRYLLSTTFCRKTLKFRKQVMDTNYRGSPRTFSNSLFENSRYRYNTDRILADATSTWCQYYHQIGFGIGYPMSSLPLNRIRKSAKKSWYYQGFYPIPTRCHPYHWIESLSAAIGHRMSQAYHRTLSHSNNVSRLER